MEAERTSDAARVRKRQQLSRRSALANDRSAGAQTGCGSIGARLGSTRRCGFGSKPSSVSATLSSTQWLCGDRAKCCPADRPPIAWLLEIALPLDRSPPARALANCLPANPRPFDGLAARCSLPERRLAVRLVTLRGAAGARRSDRFSARCWLPERRLTERLLMLCGGAGPRRPDRFTARCSLPERRLADPLRTL